MSYLPDVADLLADPPRWFDQAQWSEQIASAGSKEAAELQEIRNEFARPPIGAASYRTSDRRDPRARWWGALGQQRAGGAGRLALKDNRRRVDRGA